MVDHVGQDATLITDYHKGYLGLDDHCIHVRVKGHLILIKLTGIFILITLRTSGVPSKGVSLVFTIAYQQSIWPGIQQNLVTATITEKKRVLQNFI